ncbi:MAG: hypothetical protein HY875_16285 [Chloroflexi bacterium]|nr:hypothetical protein [Chloroflexota bacterium]
MPDEEECTWTRLFEPQAGPELKLAWQGGHLWSVTVQNPNWLYRITGCARFEGESADTQLRTMAEYLELMTGQSTPILISAPAPPMNTFAKCVVGYGEVSGGAQYLVGRVVLYIFTGSNCQVPIHDFPF